MSEENLTMCPVCKTWQTHSPEECPYRPPESSQATRMLCISCNQPTDAPVMIRTTFDDMMPRPHCAKCAGELAAPTGSEFPTTIIEVRAAKIADEIFAILQDTARGDLSNHQLVTAVILRELKKNPTSPTK